MLALQALDALRAIGFASATVRDDGGACRIRGDGATLAAVRAALEPFEAAADVIAHEGALAKLLVADMDSTMVACECLDELADYAGVKAEVAAVTARAMAGELDFAASLVERVALLADLPVAAIEACLAERVRPSPGAVTLIATLRGWNVRTVLVTGGFTHFAEPVAAMLGFDRVVANRLGIADGRLTGTVVGPIVDAATKAAVLRAESGGAGGAVAVGDGANDAPMLAAAGLGIAYRGKPPARAAAAARIAHLTSILPAMGVAREDWTILP